MCYRVISLTFNNVFLLRSAISFLYLFPFRIGHLRNNNERLLGVHLQQRVHSQVVFRNTRFHWVTSANTYLARCSCSCNNGPIVRGPSTASSSVTELNLTSMHSQRKLAPAATPLNCILGIWG